jgi:hypothetical protein
VFDTFQVPGAILTYPMSITPNGRIAGCFQAQNGAWHGFVATPLHPVRR